MKAFRYLQTAFAFAILAFTALSCAPDHTEDIAKLNDNFDKLEKRLDAVESSLASINSSLESLSVLSAAVEQDFYITAVDNSAEGYTITLSNGSTVFLQNGSDNKLHLAPAFNITRIGGVYYWTLNGLLLKGSDGLPVRSGGFTPVVKYDYSTQQYIVSVDGGVSFKNINEYTSVVINDTILYQVVNSFFQEHHTTLLSQQTLYQIISTYIQRNYASLFDVTILDKVVAEYIKENSAKIFRYELLNEIFTQYDFEYYTSQIDTDYLVNVILTFIQEHNEILTDNEVLYAIVSGYLNANRISIFSDEILVEAINRFIENNDGFLDVSLLTSVVSNYVDTHRDTVFNADTVRNLLSEFVRRYYVQAFSEELVIRLLSISISQNSSSFFNETLIREIVSSYVQDNYTAVFTKDILNTLINKYIEINASTLLNVDVLLEVLNGYFQKNYDLVIDRTVIERTVNDYLELHKDDIISIEIIESVITEYLNKYYVQVFDIDLLSTVINNYFTENLKVITEHIIASVDPVKDVNVYNNYCDILLRNGETLSFVVFDTYAVLRDRIQSVVVIPQGNGHIDGSTLKSGYLSLNYLVSPAPMARVMRQMYNNGKLTLEIYTTDAESNVGTLDVTKLTDASDNLIMLHVNTGRYESIKTIALHIKDNDSGGTDILTEFTPVDADGPEPLPGAEPEAVDLGLKVKWASFNVGASKPEEFGDYFAWGETEPKAIYTWTNYKFRTSGSDGDDVKLSKYNTESSSGTVDYNTVLESGDDAARANWGGGWRMPTDDDWEELLDNCTSAWTNNYNGTGVAGRVMTSKKTGYTDKSIFLPAAGFWGDSCQYEGLLGTYWSSSLFFNDPIDAYVTGFDSENVNMTFVGRAGGLSVRPVLEENAIPVTSIELDKTSLTLEKGDKYTFKVFITPENATDKSLRWTSSDESVVIINDYGSNFGMITAVNEGTATVSVYASNGVSASCTVTVKSAGPDAVDLGLPSGTLWASCNLGASSPEESGDYFAWGETEPKASYDWNNYRWGSSSYTKYVLYEDFKTALDPSDDAATAILGSDWRMPSGEELEELTDPRYCTCAWTTLNGVKGYTVTSKSNGNSIFLPAAACMYGSSLWYGEFGLYMSSSLDIIYRTWGSEFTASLYFSETEEGSASQLGGDWNMRRAGQTVRPVKKAFAPVSGISLNIKSIEMIEGEEVTLKATVAPANATHKDVSWVCSDENIASLRDSDRSTVVARAEGETEVRAYAADGTHYATCKVKVIKESASQGEYKGHEYVDLGLPSGLKWATMNVGASKPEEYGDYFAWGETQPKSSYSWSTYKWCNGSSTTLSKYNTSSSNGTVDNKTQLDLADDAARANWGGSWRMPTTEEYYELLEKCTWTWTSQNGVNGRKVTGPNGNSIFLPAAGYRYGASLYDVGSWGYYWSSSLFIENPDFAYPVYFDSSGIDWDGDWRYSGFSVRPVSE